MSGHNGDFQDLSNEIRLGGATAATLRVKMADIRHGHVVGVIEELVPIEISIKNAGTVASGAELPAVVVNAGDTTKEFLAIEEKVAALQAQKRELADALFGEGGAAVGGLTREDLENLLA